MLLLINTLGWIGSIFIIAAYWFNSQGKMESTSIWYQMLNLLGGLFLSLNCFYFQVYPSAVLNLVWILIAIASLNRLYKFNFSKKKLTE